jgi:hypothetical protein
MKQTAVDYLIQELFTVHDENFDFNPVFKKAKEIEKQQIFDALKVNEIELLCWGITAEDYYNKTFKTKENESK